MSTDSESSPGTPDPSQLAGVFRDGDTAPSAAVPSVSPTTEPNVGGTRVMNVPTVPVPPISVTPPPPPPSPPMSCAPPPPAPPPGGMVLVPATPPAVTSTVLITLFFGLFGLIPATIGSGKAKAVGQPGGRYWSAFGFTYLGRIMLEILLVLSLNLFGISVFPAQRVSAPPGYQYTAAPGGYTAPAGSQPSDPSYSAPPSGTADSPYVSPGSWVTVLDSVSQNAGTLAEARTIASSLSSQYGVTVYVVDSGSYPGLNPGYWAVLMTGYSSNEQARASCSQVGRVPGDDCYGRKIRG